MEEIQAAVNGVVSQEQAIKQKQRLIHINELETHKRQPELEMFRVKELFR